MRVQVWHRRIREVRRCAVSGCALLCFQSRDRQVQLLPFRLLLLLSSVRKHGPLGGSARDGFAVMIQTSDLLGGLSGSVRDHDREWHKVQSRRRPSLRTVTLMRSRRSRFCIAAEVATSEGLALQEVLLRVPRPLRLRHLDLRAALQAYPAFCLPDSISGAAGRGCGVWKIDAAALAAESCGSM